MSSTFPDPDHAPTDPFTGEELKYGDTPQTLSYIASLKASNELLAQERNEAVRELQAEVESLRCCCKCMHSDHDAPSYGNWWCEFDPEPMNPGEYSTIEPHENCHFSPSRWERITYSTAEEDVANSDYPLG
jgi:hypothetical protein